MAIRASGKKKCSDCENLKRKLKENDHTVSARDVLIKMLQTELKKKEGLYRNAIDEHEKLRFMHCSIVQDYTNLKEIHKELTEENKRLCEENQNLLAKIRETENLPKSPTEPNKQNGEPFEKKGINNINSVADGICNIQTIMQCQNNSLRTMLVQLLDELKKSRTEQSPERDNQHIENKDNRNETNESLKKQIEDLNSFTLKLQKENKKIKENLCEKQVSLKNCLAVLENNNSDIDNLSKHVEGLCNQRDKYSEQVTALENKLVSKESEISKLKSETEQIGVLENANSKLNSDVCYLKSQIEMYLSEYKKLKHEIETTVRDKTKYQTQMEQLQDELQEKLLEFEYYKKDMLITIDELKNDLEAARVEQESRGIQCTINRLALCNASTQECPIMKNKAVQSLEDFLTVFNKNTQVNDLEITGSSNKPFEKKMIEVEVHRQELQSLDNEFLQYRCVMDYRIQSLEKDNNELKENLSIMSSDHERNLRKVDENYHKSKDELASKVKELEHDISILDSQNSVIKSELVKIKNENRMYVFENTGLRETLSDMINENRETLKKLEENYCICKHAFETKIKQLEEEIKHLRDTLHIVTTEDNKSIEDDFNTLKTVLENKIRTLEQENNYLKEIVNCTTNNYEAKLAKKEAEKKELADNISKTTAQNQTTIKNLIDTQNQYLQNIIHQIPNSDPDVIGVGENLDLKTILQLKIKQLIDNKFKLEQRLGTVSSENVSYLNTIEELSKSSVNSQIHANKNFRVLTCLLGQVDKNNQTDETKDMKNENNELKEELNEMQRKLLTLEMELENANLELTEYEEENRSYSQRLHSLMNEIANLQDTKLHAETDINNYNLRVIQLQEELSIITNDRDHAIAELNNKITELEYKVIDFDCNVSKLKESEKENKQLQNKLDDTQTILNNVRNELNSLISENNKFQSLEKLLHEKDEQLSEYCNNINLVEEELKDNKSKCQEHKNKIQDLESKMEILEGEIAENKNKIQDLESKKEILEGEIAEYKKSMEETSRETDRLKKLLSDLEEERTIFKNTNLEKTELSEQLSSLQEQVKNLQEQLKKKQTIIRSLEECIDKSNNVLQRCEKEMKIIQKENKFIKNELEMKIKKENSFTKKKTDKLFEENQLLKEQVKKGNYLKIEYNRLLKLSQAKDKNLKNLREELMVSLAGQTKKPVAAPKSVSFAANTKLFDPKTKQSKQGCSKSNDSGSNTPKTKKEVRHDAKKKSPTFLQGRPANQKTSNLTRSSHYSNAFVATAGLKSESSPIALRKEALTKNKRKDMSVYLTLSNPYPSENDAGETEKTRAGSGDEETVSRVYGGPSEVPRNRPNNGKASKWSEKLPTSHKMQSVDLKHFKGSDPITVMPLDLGTFSNTNLSPKRSKSIGLDPILDGDTVRADIRYSSIISLKKSKSNVSVHQSNSDGITTKLVSSLMPSEFLDDEEIMEPEKLTSITVPTIPEISSDSIFDLNRSNVPEKNENGISTGTTPKPTTESIDDVTIRDQRKNGISSTDRKNGNLPNVRVSRLRKRTVSIQGDNVNLKKDKSGSRPEEYNDLDDEPTGLNQPISTDTLNEDNGLSLEMPMDDKEHTDRRERISSYGGFSLQPIDTRRNIKDATDNRMSTSKATEISPKSNFDGTADIMLKEYNDLDDGTIGRNLDDESLSLNILIENKERTYPRETIKPIAKSATDTPPDLSVTPMSRMTICVGTDPIEELRLCRCGTASPETSPDKSTEQKERILWTRKIYVPTEKICTDSRSRNVSDPMERKKQKSKQINKTSCNCMTRIRRKKQYQQDGTVQKAYAEKVTCNTIEQNQDGPCPNVNHTGCSISLGSSYWAQGELDSDNNSDESISEEINIYFSTKCNCEKDAESFDVCDCEDEESSSSDVSS